MLILATTIPGMIFSFYGLWQQTVNHVQVGNKATPDYAYVITIVFLTIALWVFYRMKLEVSIEKDGIHYRFFPQVYKYKIISKAEIERYEIRKYSPIIDYGGWGLRRGFGRKWGRGLIVDGNMGLQIYLANGKKILFSTQRSQAIMHAMEEMMKSNTA